MALTIFHIALAVVLFYLVNWVGKHSSAFGYLQLSLFARGDHAPAFNLLLKAFAPAVYVLLVATTLYSIHLDGLITRIWLVAAYYFTFRLLYNLVLGRALLLNWFSLIVQSVLGTGVAFLAYAYLILPRRPLFPDPKDVGSQLWFAIALFLYAAFNSVRTSGEASARRKNNYLRSRFWQLRETYGDLIEGRFPERYMELVAFAVLIEETFNRPWIVQKLERLAFP